MPTFRIHTDQGAKDIEAETPAEAIASLGKRHPGIRVGKVKVLKERADG